MSTTVFFPSHCQRYVNLYEKIDTHAHVHSCVMWSILMPLCQSVTKQIPGVLSCRHVTGYWHTHTHTHLCAPDLVTEQMSSIFVLKETNKRQQEVDSTVTESIYNGCINRVEYGVAVNDTFLCGTKNFPSAQAGWKLEWCYTICVVELHM